MNLIITGTVFCLLGLGIINYGYSLTGIIVFLVGGALGLKGRKKIDKP